MVIPSTPGVVVVEKDGSPAPQSLAVDVGGFVGAAERGPLNKAVFVSNFADFEKKFGSFYQGNYLAYALRGFFDEGGSRAIVVRIAGAGAAKATANAIDFGGNNTISLTASSEGAWGNNLHVEFEKFSSTTTAALTGPGSASSVVLQTVVGLEVGDYLEIDGGSGNDKIQVVVQAIDVATNTITFSGSASLTNGIPAGSTAKTATQHRLSTKLSSDLAAGTYSQITVEDARNARPGQLIVFGDNTGYYEAVVSSVQGNDILFTSSITTTGNLTAASSFVVSQEFQLKVYESGILEEVFDYLSLSSANKSDFIDSRLSGVGNRSSLIEAQDLGAGDLLLNFPAPGKVSLTGGNDGATPGDADFIGSEANKSGIYALSQIEPGDSFFCVPGITSVAVHSAMIAYAEKRGNTVALLDMPFSVDSLGEALEYKKILLNKDSSYAALYYPWLKVIDPENTSSLLEMPPSGYVAGIYAKVATRDGIQSAPANEAILSAVGVVVDVSSEEHGILNSEHINVIRSVPGQGVKILGARTLTSLLDGRHYVNVRRVLNYVKLISKDLLQFALFKPHTEGLRLEVSSTLSSFLDGLWRNGVLFGSTAEQAYFVKADEENNTKADIEAGILNVAVGLSVVRPAEFIILQLGLNVNTGFQAAEA